MNTGMTLDKAKRIVALVVAARKRWGKQAQPNVKMEDLFEALVVLHDSANLDAPSKDEVTLLRRQLAACQNREKARKDKDVPVSLQAFVDKVQAEGGDSPSTIP